MVTVLIEQPLARWEKQQGAEGTDDALERKADDLEKNFLVQYEEALARVLRRWGIKEPLPKGDAGEFNK